MFASIDYCIIKQRSRQQEIQFLTNTKAVNYVYLYSVLPQFVSKLFGGRIIE